MSQYDDISRGPSNIQRGDENRNEAPPSNGKDKMWKRLLEAKKTALHSADCFNFCVVIGTLFPAALVLVIVVPKVMADDGLTTAHEFIKLLAAARQNCHRKLASEERPKNADGEYLTVYCHGEWDKISCWPNSAPGMSVSINCPEYVEDFDHSGTARRYCNPRGKWALTKHGNQTWSDYSDCRYPDLDEANRALSVTKPEEKSMIQLYTVGYSFSLVSLIIAVIILGYFKRLHCTRNYIHMHLFASFILRGTVIFVKDQVLFYGSGILDVSTSNGAIDALHSYLNSTAEKGGAHMVKCKLVMTFFHYFVATNYYWILVEALYLHSLIFVAFFSDKKYLWRFIITGWGVPVLFVVPWAIVRAVLDGESCWDVAVEEYKWIYNGPILVASVINFLLFLNIIRVLWYKMRERGGTGRSDNRRQYKKLAKSTLVLIPMFGVHAIVFIAMPDHVTSGTWWYARMYFDLFFNSFQGFFVAIIYCFCNGEVQAEFKKAWERFNLSVEIQKGRRERSRSSVTMLTSFNSSASHQARLSIGGSTNGKGMAHRHNGSHMTRPFNTAPDLKEVNHASSAPTGCEMESSFTAEHCDNNNLTVPLHQNGDPPITTTSTSPLLRAPCIRTHSSSSGGLGGFASRGPDVILPIAEEGELEEEFEKAIERHTEEQIACPAGSFDLSKEQEKQEDIMTSSRDDAIELDDEVIEHDENAVMWRKHRSRVKRAESEDSGISSNFFSSMRRGSGGAPALGRAKEQRRSNCACDSAASGSESEGFLDCKVAPLLESDEGSA